MPDYIHLQPVMKVLLSTIRYFQLPFTTDRTAIGIFLFFHHKDTKMPKNISIVNSYGPAVAISFDMKFIISIRLLKDLSLKIYDYMSYNDVLNTRMASLCSSDFDRFFVRKFLFVIFCTKAMILKNGTKKLSRLVLYWYTLQCTDIFFSEIQLTFETNN